MCMTQFCVYDTTTKFVIFLFKKKKNEIKQIFLHIL